MAEAAPNRRDDAIGVPVVAQQQTVLFILRSSRSAQKHVLMPAVHEAARLPATAVIGRQLCEASWLFLRALIAWGKLFSVASACSLQLCPRS